MIVWALFHAIHITRNSYFSLSMQNQAIGKFSKKFLYLAPYPHIDFTIEAGKKFMSKKKPQEIGLLSSKKLSIGSFILLLGTFLCFHFFDFGPRQVVAFFLTFFWIFSGFPIANLFSPIPRALLIRRDRFLFLCNGGTFLFPLIPNLAQLICSKSIKNPNIGKKIRKFAKIGKKIPPPDFSGK